MPHIPEWSIARQRNEPSTQPGRSMSWKRAPLSEIQLNSTEGHTNSYSSIMLHQRSHLHQHQEQQHPWHATMGDGNSSKLSSSGIFSPILCSSRIDISSMGNMDHLATNTNNTDKWEYVLQQRVHSIVKQHAGSETLFSEVSQYGSHFLQASPTTTLDEVFLSRTKVEHDASSKEHKDKATIKEDERVSSKLDNLMTTLTLESLGEETSLMDLSYEFDLPNIDF